MLRDGLGEKVANFEDVEVATKCGELRNLERIALEFVLENLEDREISVVPYCMHS